jgi:hypothetical protein
MYTNILMPTDGSELAGKAVARHRLGQANQRQSHGADRLATVSYVHDRHPDD